MSGSLVKAVKDLSVIQLVCLPGIGDGQAAGIQRYEYLAVIRIMNKRIFEQVLDQHFSKQGISFHGQIGGILYLYGQIQLFFLLFKMNEHTVNSFFYCRSVERSVGKACVSTFRSRWGP